MGRYLFWPYKGKINHAKFISDFSDKNRHLKHKIYLIQKMSEMPITLEGFKYDKQHDLIIGYYHIWLSENIINLFITILPWGK